MANVETDVLIGKRGNRIAYKVSVPDDYATGKETYPLLIHLHGHGGQGSDPSGMGGPLGRLWKEKYEFIGIFPQALKGLSWWHPQMLEAMMDVIKEEQRRLRIDGARIYITGQSMGGYGSYQMAARYPRFFAAVAPISGAWGPYKDFSMPSNLTRWQKVPFWAFHGDRDTKAPYKDAQKTMERLREADVYSRFTVYPGGGHHVKQMVYANPRFFDWLLAQELDTPHNYELSTNDGNESRLIGFFEPGIKQSITARKPDVAKDDVFAGWTSAAGTTVKHTTTHPTTSPGRLGTRRAVGTFEDAGALTSTFTMPAHDVIVTANYKIDPNYRGSPGGGFPDE